MCSRALKSAVAIVILCQSAIGAEKPAALTIRVMDKSQWDASTEDVKKVLYSSAGELMRYFPERKLPPVEVQPRGGPITLFARGPAGEIRVKLSTGSTLWSQYAFQFAHEMGHILCNYKEHEHKNKWFEESVCELASLFVLRRMKESWKTQPPYPNWKDYAPRLGEYAGERIKKSTLSGGQTLAKWYEDNAVVLAGNATDRERNNVVATALLPLFEAAPEHWEAVGDLNTEKLTPLHTFKDYLTAWHTHTPEKHKAFVAKIAAQFGIELSERK